MPTMYAQKQITAQKKDVSSASSVLDASSQSESLQRKADMANNSTQIDVASINEKSIMQKKQNNIPLTSAQKEIDQFGKNWRALDRQNYISQYGLKQQSTGRNDRKFIQYFEDGSLILTDTDAQYWRHETPRSGIMVNGNPQFGYYDRNHTAQPEDNAHRSETHFWISENLRKKKMEEVAQLRKHSSNTEFHIKQDPKLNNTGMPDNLKSGIESLSGFSMDDVRVHYNSSKPATVQALAYTQGTDIHVAPGQEKHLPHEAWHVAQQMAGRVSPTTNINGMPVNDNAALEHEADVMGEKAVQRMKNGENVVPKVLQCSGNAIQCVNHNRKRYNKNRMRLEENGRKNKSPVRYNHKKDSSMRQRPNLRMRMLKNKKIKTFLLSRALRRRTGEIKSTAMTDQAVLMSENKLFGSLPSVLKNKINESVTLEDIKSKVSAYGKVESFEKLDTGLVVRISCSEVCSNKAQAFQRISDVVGVLGDAYMVKRKLAEGFIMYVFVKVSYKTNHQNETYMVLVFNISNNHPFGGKDVAGYVVGVKKYSHHKGSLVESNIVQENGTSGIVYDSEHSVRRDMKTPILDATYRPEKKTRNYNDSPELFGNVVSDSYTKLAAEGARFLCVRRNIQWLNDNTVFYAKNQTQGVTFAELWKTWGASFNSGFGIEDKTVSDKLVNHKNDGYKNTLSMGGRKRTTAVNIKSETVKIGKEWYDNSVCLDGKDKLNSNKHRV